MIYFDTAATAPLESRVKEAMRAYEDGGVANPGSLHREGVRAKKALDTARGQVAALINAHADEIVFTSGGTESNNLAILGLLRSRSAPLNKLHVVTTTIEHPSVRDLLKSLEKEGLSVAYVPVQEDGTVSAKEVLECIEENTVLVSIMHVNNEVGSVLPVEEIGRGIFARNKKQEDAEKKIFFHVDACQSLPYLSVSVAHIHCDLLTGNGPKLYGPQGIGFLYVARNLALTPLSIGGHQERAMRPGTEYVAGAVGLGKAAEIARTQKEEDREYLERLRQHLITALQREFPKSILNGPREGGAPHIINISFPSFDNEFLVLALDARGIMVGTKSACLTEESSVSYVVEALGPKHDGTSAIRIGLGRENTEKEIDTFITELKDILNIQGAAPVLGNEA